MPIWSSRPCWAGCPDRALTARRSDRTIRRAMHILHVVQLYYPVASGAARYFAEIGERLVGEGHQVTVLATDAYDLEHFWMAGRRHIDAPEEDHHGVRI